MRTCDICYDEVEVNGTYRVFGESYDSIYVTDRGYLSFGSAFTVLYPNNHLQAFTGATVVAPLWLDMYQYANMPGLQPFHIWYRETTDPTLLTKAQEAVQQNFGSCGDLFTPTHLFIVTWQRMPSYCDYIDYYSYYSSYSSSEYSSSEYSSYKRDVTEEEDGETGEPSAERPDMSDVNPFPPEGKVTGPGEWAQNGFQAVIATDGCDTFALFNYRDIEYEYCYYYGLTAINAGDGIRYWKHPDTYQAGLGQALTEGTNAGLAGRWIYKLSESQIRDPDCAVISD